MTETIVSEKEEKEFAEFLHEKIKEYNNLNSPHHRKARKPGSSIPLNIILKNDSGNFIGGLAASTYWQWLDIDDFYIPKEFRGKGIGASLLRTAEKIAIERECTRCFLSTFEFQGRVFYEKQGYYVAGKLEDYPPGSAYYWMRKDLVPKRS
ncbi:MAG: GNAT family N-acetyltransferase [Chloroflexi bacterium]|nr:GNAT family N-acetyltransferase [Chloroflexota bacterium]